MNFARQFADAITAHGHEALDSMKFVSFSDLSQQTSQSILKDLNSSNITTKISAMCRIVAMMAKGIDMVNYFPHVVKNVATQSTDVKRLVYIYLERYAQQEQDLALLSINSFQKDLDSPNQLVRAMALRVLSGIHNVDASPIVMLGIKKCAKDSSPYVRKISALALTKIYSYALKIFDFDLQILYYILLALMFLIGFSVDKSRKMEIFEVITLLLKDISILVIGTTIMAYNTICPNNFELLHQPFRKLCRMVLDLDEWSQIILLQTFLGYARSQFLDPNKQPILESNDVQQLDNTSTPEIDPDLKLMLDSTAPLFQSRNSAVVMAVSALYFYTAPESNLTKIVQPLLRQLWTSSDVATISLLNIRFIVQQKPYLFTQHSKMFFLKSTDTKELCKLKLDILSNISTKSNIHLILKELLNYSKRSDRDFAINAIDAIGKCAIRIPDVIEQCLLSLMQFVSSNFPEYIIQESIIAIRKLISTGICSKNTAIQIITKLAKRFNLVNTPKARADCIWLIAEFSQSLTRIIPDILRKLAKTFPEEHRAAKIQIIAFAAKACIIRPECTSLLFSFILEMSKYDIDYDVRDFARFIRSLILDKTLNPGFGGSIASSIIISPSQDLISILFNNASFQYINDPHDIDFLLKDSIKTQNKTKNFCLGSLSHVLSMKMNQYNELNDFPTTAPDPSTRDTISGDSTYNPWVPPTLRNLSRTPSSGSHISQNSEGKITVFDGKSKVGFDDIDAFYGVDETTSEESKEESSEEDTSTEETSDEDESVDT